jgi:hypothetical protein
MAKLSAHGKEIGRIQYIGHDVAVMSDGYILKNFGAGWKIHGKLKAGLTPEMAYQKRLSALENQPFEYYAFREKLFALTRSLEKRAQIMTALQLLGNDADGVWSELTDSYLGPRIDADIVDIVELCQAHESYQTALKSQKAQAN